MPGTLAAGGLAKRCRVTRLPELYGHTLLITGRELLWESQRLKSRGAGRNEPCPCGSGNKFERCCGR